jgi:CRP-like cAMP-binding protein
MEELAAQMRRMIAVSDAELATFMRDCELRTYDKKEVLAEAHKVAHTVFFVLEGILRVVVTDYNGVDQTVHFAREGEFIADYSSFLRQQPAAFRLEAISPLRVVRMPRTAIEWGYAHMAEGEKMGRLIAEYYFIYLDDRIQSQYTRRPEERYARMGQIFPDIHNRVPQHMIASYLGITPVHLSRIKKAARPKS